MAAPKPQLIFRPVAELTPNPRNARVHSEAQIDQVVNSIIRFGWTNPVVADDTMIDAGHGRCMAAERIYAAGGRIFMAPGEERGGVPVPDGCVPVVNSTGWTEDEKRAYGLADNALALNSTWDEEILKAELDALKVADFDVTLIGFDTEQFPQTGTNPGGTGGTGGNLGPLEDSQFQHVDQYGIIIKCANAAEQEARFNVLKEQYGADNVKVVVV